MTSSRSIQRIRTFCGYYYYVFLIWSISFQYCWMVSYGFQIIVPPSSSFIPYYKNSVVSFCINKNTNLRKQHHHHLLEYNNKKKKNDIILLYFSNRINHQQQDDYNTIERLLRKKQKRMNNNKSTITSSSLLLSNVVDIDGLLPETELNRQCQLNHVLKKLQKQLPYTLLSSLTDQTSKYTYTDDTKLVISIPNINNNNDGSNQNSIILADSRKELISISQSIVLLLQLTSNSIDTVYNTLSTTFGQSSLLSGTNNNINNRMQNKENNNDSTLIQCSMIIKHKELITNSYQSNYKKNISAYDINNNVVIKLEWDVNLFSILPDGISRTINMNQNRNNNNEQQQQILSGISYLTLDSQNEYKVSIHEIQNIRWNDNYEVDPVTIGQTLASLRRTAQLISKQATVSTSSIPFLSQVSNIWNQVRDEVLLISQQDNSNNDINDDKNIARILIEIPNDNSTTSTTTNKKTKTLLSNVEGNEATEYNEKINTNKLSLIPIDEYVGVKQYDSKISFPLPGSMKWNTYVYTHKTCHIFATYVISILSESSSLQITTSKSLFSKDVKLIGLDSNVLLSGYDRLDNFYQSLATIRKVSNGQWIVKKCKILGYIITNNNNNIIKSTINDQKLLLIKISIDYVSTIKIPSIVQPLDLLTISNNNNRKNNDSNQNIISIYGTDIYTMSLILPPTSLLNQDDIINNNDIKSIEDFYIWCNNNKYKIEKIEQKQFQIKRGDHESEGEWLLRNDNNNNSNNNNANGIWFMKSLITALESGTIQSIDSQTVVNQLLFRLLNRVINNESVSSVDKMIVPSTKTSSINQYNKDSYSIIQKKINWKKRNDQAAIIIYRIMESLHNNDLIKIVRLPMDDREISNKVMMTPPAGNYISNDIQLLGYLDEVLVRGYDQYYQSIGILIRTLQMTIQSGRIISEKDPNVLVELTSNGNIRYSFTLYLKLTSKVLSNPLSDLIGNNNILSDAITSSYQLSSFTIQLISEYIINDDTGYIDKHRLLESRINGQLTPGDVISRWMNRFLKSDIYNNNNDNNNNDNKNEMKWIQQLLRDVVDWLLLPNK